MSIKDDLDAGQLPDFSKAPRWLLKSGAPPHVFTPEDRKKGNEVFRARKREAAKTLYQKKAELVEERAKELLEKEWALLRSEKEEIAQRQLTDTYDRHLGKPVQRTITADVTPTTRLEDLPREQRDALIAEKKRQLELLLSNQADIEEE